MKIGIINQPTKNRGDEAAHKSFMRLLLEKLPMAKFRIYFIEEEWDTINQMKISHKNVEYINISSFSKGYKWLMKKALVHNIKVLAKLHPNVFRLFKYLKSDDYIICAPGGISMGGFKNWGHIYLLDMVLGMDKKLAYYSRSFGPFNNQNKQDLIFNDISLSILKRLNFLSIRDTKTFEIADSLNIEYLKSIDSAFSDCPNLELPTNLTYINEWKDYMVFVPNSLTWHPHYYNRDQSRIDNYYISILEYILDHNFASNIIMLPQLFNDNKNSDFQYFISLLNKIAPKYHKSIHILEDLYSSDIQQKIISKSNLVIGARYHSAVFAINNNVPLIALSYEHKILGLAAQLNVMENVVNIENLGELAFDDQLSLQDVFGKIDKYNDLVTEREYAESLATNCMSLLVSKISGLADR